MKDESPKGIITQRLPIALPGGHRFSVTETVVGRIYDSLSPKVMGLSDQRGKEKIRLFVHGQQVYRSNIPARSNYARRE